MHTEEDARKKWCPHVRVGNHVGCNRALPDSNGNYDKCIASECMAWQVGKDRRSPEITGTSDANVKPDGAEWVASSLPVENIHRTRWVKHRITPTGFCGLSGIPQGAAP